MRSSIVALLLVACSGNHVSAPDAGTDTGVPIDPNPTCLAEVGAPGELGGGGELIDLPDQLQDVAEYLRLEVALDSASVGANCPPEPIALPPDAPPPAPLCSVRPVLSVRGDAPPVIHDGDLATNLHDTLVDVDGRLRPSTQTHPVPGGVLLVEDRDEGPRLSRQDRAGATEVVVDDASIIEVTFVSVEVAHVLVDGERLLGSDGDALATILEANRIVAQRVSRLESPTDRWYCVEDRAGVALVALSGLTIEERVPVTSAPSCDEVARVVRDEGGALWIQTIVDGSFYGMVHRWSPGMGAPEAIVVADYHWNARATPSGWYFQHDRNDHSFVTTDGLGERHRVDLGLNPYVTTVVRGDRLAIIGRNRWTSDSVELLLLERGAVVGAATIPTSREIAPNNLQDAWLDEDGALWVAMYDEYVGPLPRDIQAHLFRFDGSDLEERGAVSAVRSVHQGATLANIDGTFYRHAGSELEPVLAAAGVPGPLFEAQWPGEVDPTDQEWLYFPTSEPDEPSGSPDFAIATLREGRLNVVVDGILLPGWRASRIDAVQDRAGRPWLYYGAGDAFRVDAWHDGSLCTVHDGIATVRYVAIANTSDDAWRTRWGVRLHIASPSPEGSERVILCPFLAEDGACLELPAGVSLFHDPVVTASGHIFGLVQDDASGRIALFRSTP